MNSFSKNRFDLKSGSFETLIKLADEGLGMTLLPYLNADSLTTEKKKNLKFRCTHVSHRGGAAENLENTMTAFKHAHNLGTEMLEIDCHITKDGIVVVSHDDLLERTTGKNVKITETNFSDLPPMKSTLDVTFCKNIGLNGLKIIEEIANKKKDTVNILTHCNAGWLATIDWGTATSPIYHAHQKGIKVHGYDSMNNYYDVNLKKARCKILKTYKTIIF